MLGYVKIDPNELKGKHLTLYRAVYCGLCRAATRRVSVFLSPFLSYDFAFLASLRLSFHPEEVKVGQKRCLIHPFKKRPMVLPCPVLEEVAWAEMVLTAGKMEDDLSDRDVSLFRRLLIRPFLSVFRRKIKKRSERDAAFASFSGTVARLLRNGRSLERENADLDRMCACFGEVLSVTFSYGCPEEEGRILARTGEMAGRFLYTIDAADDRDRDRKKGAFNPLLSGAFPEKELKQVLLFYCDQMLLALQLAKLDPDLSAISENIVAYGLKHEIERVFNQTTGVES